MAINTNPGTIVTVVKFYTEMPMGNKTILTDYKERGVLVENDGVAAKIIQVRKDGDFGGLIRTISSSRIFDTNTVTLDIDGRVPA